MEDRASRLAAWLAVLLTVSCFFTGFYEGRGMYPFMVGGFAAAAAAVIWRVLRIWQFGRKTRQSVGELDASGEKSLPDSRFLHASAPSLSAEYLAHWTGRKRKQSVGELDASGEKSLLDSRLLHPSAPSLSTEYLAHWTGRKTEQSAGELDASDQKNLLRSPFLYAIPAFVLSALYLAHLPASPLSMQDTLDQALRWAFCGVIAAALAAAAGTRQARARLRGGLAVCAALLIATSLAAVYGLAPLPHALLRTASAELSAAGVRLGGLLQYPNTLGAVFGALLLERLAALKQAAARPALQRAVHVLLAFGCAAGLLLTESRGAWLCTAAGGAVLLALAGRTARRQLLLQTAAILAGGLWLYRQLAEADLAPMPGPGLLQLAGTGAAVLGLSSMAFHAGAPEARRLHRYAVALACAGWAARAVLPSQLMTAGSGELVLRTGTSTVSARLLMYRDALWQIGTNPWWGGGGGVWRSVYRSVQTEPYVGAQVHSGYLDMLLNLGIPGLLVLVLWFTTVGFLLLKRRSLLLAPYLVLVLHAGVDFDMSYGLTWLLLLWLGVLGLAEMGAVQGRPWKTAGKERTIRLTNFSKLRKAVVSIQGYNKALRRIPWFRRNNQSGSGSQAELGRFFLSLPPTRLALALGTYMSSPPWPALRSIWNTSIKRVFGGSVPAGKAVRRGGGSSRGIHGLFRGITALTMAGVLAFMSLVSLRMLAGERLTAEAAVLLSKGKAQQARVLLEKALDLNPYRTGPRIALAAELPLLSAEHILRGGIRFSPQMSELWWALAKAQFKLDRPEAAKAAEIAVRLDRYHSRRITAALHELGRLGLRLSQAGRRKESRTAVLTGLRLYDGYRKAAEWAAGKGIRNDRKFTVTDEARREAERLWGLLGFPSPPYVAFSGRS